jgi:hypothetical protein
LRFDFLDFFEAFRAFCSRRCARRYSAMGSSGSMEGAEDAVDCDAVSSSAFTSASRIVQYRSSTDP